jgi:hypothetical protein
VQDESLRVGAAVIARSAIALATPSYSATMTP